MFFYLSVPTVIAKRAPIYSLTSLTVQILSPHCTWSLITAACNRPSSATRELSSTLPILYLRTSTTDTYYTMTPMAFTHTISSSISTTAPRTQVTTSTPSEDERTPPLPRIPDGTLRLRGGPIQDRRVTWGEDVIDNEELGRKKSKGEFSFPSFIQFVLLEFVFGSPYTRTQESFEPDRYLYPALESSLQKDRDPAFSVHVIFCTYDYPVHPIPSALRFPLVSQLLYSVSPHALEELHLHLDQSSMHFALLLTCSPQSAVSSAAPVPSANPPPKTTLPIVTPPTRTAISPWNTMTVRALLPTRTLTDTAEENIVMGGSLDVDQNAHQVLMHMRRCQRHRGRISCA